MEKPESKIYEDNMPLVSIVIVNFNGKHLLEECLESLQKIDYKNYEIILVDNNSTDDSVQFTKKYFSDIKIIELDKNYGFAIANNIAVKKAKGKFILFLNNDTIVDQKFLSELVNEIQKDDSIGIAQSLLLNLDDTIDSSGDFIDSIGIAFSSKKTINHVSNIFSAKGASMIIKKYIFEMLDGFDEKLVTSFEDVDLGWRSWIIGYRAILVPSSIVYHKGSQTIKHISKQVSFHGFKNQLAIRITNFETYLAIKNTILFFIKYGFKYFRVLIDYKLKGATKIKVRKYDQKVADKPNTVIILKAILWIIKNLKYLRNKHKKVNSTRVYSTKKLKEFHIIID